MIVFEIIFWSSVILLLHSYLFYPLIIELLSAGKHPNQKIYSTEDELPYISVLLSVYNEEQVIEKKITSTFHSSYPSHKIELIIGSDNCSDKTDTIIRKYRSEFPGLRLVSFYRRTGKAGIMNRLAEISENEILILTDANVFFMQDTIFQLVKHFRNADVGMVGGNIINREIRPDGISKQERDYLFIENRIKFKEGMIWGAMMGAFGGCYAMRKKLFRPTPATFIVDDFFLTMSVLEQGGMSVNEPDAICHEDVSNKVTEEFRRKTRIATGNFQNLVRFKKLLSPLRGGIAFAFWSHKVLRWLGPLFLILAYLSSFALLFSSDAYKVFFGLQTTLLAIPFADLLLRKLKIHFSGLRYISHFYIVNLALLNGFFKYLTGVTHNVWKPTERNQGDSTQYH